MRFEYTLHTKHGDVCTGGVERVGSAARLARRLRRRAVRKDRCVLLRYRQVDRHEVAICGWGERLLAAQPG